jgi:predicted regulator of Ras-like GTPase activity (Roadblock/LC7/MglB family)
VRAVELPRITEALKEPVRVFVRESRARIALVVRGSGQVLGQHGFTGSYEVMNVAALAAAAHASSRALANVLGSRGWQHLYHAGSERSIFLAPISTPVEELILVVIFDAETSLGVVQFFFERFASAAAALPEFQRAGVGTDQASFERDLEAGLKRVFAPGRAVEG